MSRQTLLRQLTSVTLMIFLSVGCGTSEVTSVSEAPTATPTPPSTSTLTHVPPTPTSLPLPTSTPTEIPPTGTKTPTNTPTATSTPTFTPTPTDTATPTPSPTPENITITGIIADCRHPYGSLVGIPNAIVSYADTNATTDEQGRFSITVPGDDSDPFLEITTPGYVPYRERLSRMVEGAFYLIPEDLYRGVYLVLWNREPSNPQNWHRKWEQQTEFVIVRTGANEQQINTILSLLTTDEYSRMTGGRFTSTVQPQIVDRKPIGSDREGKTVISFAPGIIPGGIAHSEDRGGIIYYAEITWNVDQNMDAHVFWHEMFHTVTTGGHINEWPSVVSEVETTGYVTENDEQILNCIYNSPPRRAQPVF